MTGIQSGLPVGDSAALRLLVDRLAIHDLYVRYFDALDERRWGLFDEVFTEDVQSTSALGRTFDGREPWVSYIVEHFPGLGPTHHIMGNLAVAVEGDVAETTVRARCYHAGSGPRSHLFEESLARFPARAVRTPRGWRFDRFAETIAVMLGTTDVFGTPSDEESVGRVS